MWRLPFATSGRKSVFVSVIVDSKSYIFIEIHISMSSFRPIPTIHWPLKLHLWILLIDLRVILMSLTVGKLSDIVDPILFHENSFSSFLTEDGLVIRASLKHLMACLNFVFGWSEASTSNNRSLLQEAFEDIALKIAAGSSTAASTQRAASEALEVRVGKRRKRFDD